MFQQVFDLIQEYLPIEWNKVVVYAGYGSGSYSINFHVMKSDNSYVDCYNLKTCSKAQLIKLFMNINRVFEPSRTAKSGKSPWTVCTMIVDSNGNMKTSFDYEDISENSIEYEKKWKERYLK